MTNNFLRITPLGGLGEIGLNCQLWDTAEGTVLVDCGIMFPDDQQLGIDVVIPPFDPILKRREQILGVVITHGHEDHIGALPWLVAAIKDLNIYGSPFTLALVEHKLRERGLSERANLITVNHNSVITLGSLTFNFFPVNHSIPQGYALAVESPVGRIIHTGDFKFDPTGSFGMQTDIRMFSDFASKGLRLLLSDSTNVEVPGFSRTESVVKDALRDIFSTAKGRIIITLFSSHIERINSVFEIAKEFNRCVVISGRSLSNNIEKAKDHGFLNALPELFNDFEVPDLSDDRMVILATGSQGEPLSALARITMGEHKQLKIREGDSVIMSSRAIPGNARAVNRMVNKMYKLGARVYQEGVHATGHAHKEELREVLLATNPSLFIPIHGEFRHMVRHMDLAIECGMRPEQIFMLEDGEPLFLLPDSAVREEKIQADSVLVDGKGVGDVGALVLRERQLLGGDGVVVVAMVIDAINGETIYGPEMISRGFVFTDHFDHVLDDAKCLVLDQLEDRKKGDDLTRLSDRIRSSLRGFFRKVIGRDPVVLPVIIEL